MEETEAGQQNVASEVLFDLWGRDWTKVLSSKTLFL